MTEWMTHGEANWILWGLALQAGFCPRDRALLVTPPGITRGLIMYRCDRCHRDWYLDRETGQCCGWWLTSKGWTWKKAPGY